MSALETLRPYFRERMLAVSKLEKMDFREHEDAFNIENVANSKLDCAWHLLMTGGTLASFNQYCLAQNVTLVLTAWVKGYKTPTEAVDSGAKKIEAIVKECCRHSKRLTQPFIKNVVPTGFNIEAIDATNDNIAKLVINFTCLVHIDVPEI